MPALKNAGGDSSTLPKRRLSRGRWRVINYQAERADYEHLRGCERALSAVNDYADQLAAEMVKSPGNTSPTFGATQSFWAQRSAPNNSRAVQAKPGLGHSGSKSTPSLGGKRPCL